MKIYLSFISKCLDQLAIARIHGKQERTSRIEYPFVILVGPISNAAVIVKYESHESVHLTFIGLRIEHPLLLSCCGIDRQQFELRGRSVHHAINNDGITLYL